jgi:hypothetical protein
VGWCSDHGLPHSALLSWDPADRAKLVAHLVESAAKCQMCGTSAWEWESDRQAYTPVTEICWGCYVKDGAMEDAAPQPGSRVVLVPAKVAEARVAATPRFKWDEDD